MENLLQSYEDREALPVAESPEPEPIEKPIRPRIESKWKREERLSKRKRVKKNGKRLRKKKVTFDLNVKTYEELSTEGFIEIESEVKTHEEKVPPCPPNQRYQDCEEYEDLVLVDTVLDDGEDDNGSHGNGESGNGQVFAQEQESSESLFSLSIDSRKQGCAPEYPGEKEVNSPMPKSGCGSANVELKPIGSNSNLDALVLNPVENLSKWKEVRERADVAFKHKEKENINSEQNLDMVVSPEPSFKILKVNSKETCDNKKLDDQQIAVDASLSSWLVESEATPLPKRASLARSRGEDREVLGELKVEKLQQVSACVSSPRQSPIIGTVGSYWHHTGQIIDSDSSSSSKGKPNVRSENREKAGTKWNSTPFKARLERGVVEV